MSNERPQKNKRVGAIFWAPFGKALSVHRLGVWGKYSPKARPPPPELGDFTIFPKMTQF